ncbi:MAG: hypothetical protein HYX34_08140 [Actinobacteria bacterium]|nr:hypothetical protein [Actinomycetota bacterium]
MRTTTKQLLASAAVAASGALMVAAPASAQSSGASTYRAELQALNGSGGSGTATLTLNGDQATITETVSGLASTLPASLKGGPYPHVQHIHIDGQGVCPTTAADANNDGVLSTTEGGPSYGPIGTSLTTSGDTSAAAGLSLNVAPTGSTFSYSRTITLDAKSLAAVTSGKGVVVVHGLDPAKLPKAGLSPSDLVPALPLAATSPALCGTLVASTQMGQMPSGAPQTGGGSTSGTREVGTFVAGGGLVAAAAIALGLRKRAARTA